jgi:hypothetical protein
MRVVFLLMVFLYLGHSSVVYAAEASPFANDPLVSVKPRGGYFDEYALRPIVLPSGGVQVFLPLMFNLSKDAVGKPVMISPELSIGLDAQLTFRLYTRNSFRIEKDSRVMDDLGVGGLYYFSSSGNWQFAGLGAFEIHTFRSPVTASLRIGLAMKYIASPWSVAVDPQIRLGIVNRDRMEDEVDFPVEVAYQYTRETAFFIQTGLFLGEHGSWIPLAPGVNYLYSHGLDMGVLFKFPRFLGDGATANARELWLYLRWRTF